MNYVDMRTVIFDGVINNAVCALVMGLLWYQNRKRYAGIDFWFLDYVLQIAGLSLVFLRGHIPDLASFVLGNTLILSGLLALYMGLERFTGKVGSQVHNLVLLGLFVCSQSYFTFHTPSLTARSFNVSAALLALFIQCAWLLWRRADAEMRAMTHGAAVIFSCYCLVTVVRLGFFATHAANQDFFNSGTLDALLVLMYQVLLVLLTYSLFLMVNRRLLGEIQSYAAAAESANRAKTRFLANMSHEFRTPMSAITGFSNLLLDSEPAPEQRGHLEAIKQSSQILLVLLNDVLDLAKVEAGKLVIEGTPFDPRLVVEETARMLRPGAESKGLRLETRVQAEVPRRLLGDPTRLKQVLTNLVGNAVKFTERGSIGISVETAPPEGAAARLRFCVRDTGLGIAAHQLPRIFTPFAQSDDSVARASGGAGLGLNISLELVRLMGGRLEVESREGEGSSFYFSLPFGEAAPDAAAAKPAPAQAAVRSLRILLVEDTETNRRLAVLLLEKRGHRVTAALSGRSGISWLRQEAFDLVLLDLQLPDMDGFAVMAAMRGAGASEAMRRVPVVAFTARVTHEARQRCLAAGISGFLPKPFSTAELYLAVEGAAAEVAVPALKTTSDKLSRARAELLRRYPGEEAFVEETLQVFQEEAPGMAVRIRSAVEAGDMWALALHAHACKSAAITAGFTPVHDLAERLEDAARRADREAARKLLRELEREMELA